MDTVPYRRSIRNPEQRQRGRQSRSICQLFYTASQLAKLFTTVKKTVAMMAGADPMNNRDRSEIVDFEGTSSAHAVAPEMRPLTESRNKAIETCK